MRKTREIKALKIAVICGPTLIAFLILAALSAAQEKRQRGPGLSVAPLVNYQPVSLDTFTAPDGTELSTRNGEYNTGWTEAFYAHNSKDLIFNGQLTHDGAAYRNVYYANPPLTQNQYVQVSLTVRTGTTESAGLVFRLHREYENYYYAIYSASQHAWIIGHNEGYTDGVLTDYALGTSPESLQPGDTRQLRVEANGAQLSLYVDGVLRVNVIDTDDPSSDPFVVAGILMSGAGTANTGFALDVYEAGMITGGAPAPSPSPSPSPSSTFLYSLNCYLEGGKVVCRQP